MIKNIFVGVGAIILSTAVLAATTYSQDSTGVVKLSPKIRSTPLASAEPVIPIDKIRPFLKGVLIVTAKQLKDAPYIIQQTEEHVVTGAGDQVYVMGQVDHKQEYAVFKQGQELKNDKNRQVLGYEMIEVGRGEIAQMGQPATFLITNSKQEIETGYKLFPASEAEFTDDITVTYPHSFINGEILAVLEGITQIGQYQLVMINQGLMQGLQAGNLLGVYQATASIENPQAGNHGVTSVYQIGKTNNKMTLPAQMTGNLLIIKAFTDNSYGIILNATQAIHVGDMVGNLKN